MPSAKQPYLEINTHVTVNRYVQSLRLGAAASRSLETAHGRLFITQRFYFFYKVCTTSVHPCITTAPKVIVLLGYNVDSLVLNPTLITIEADTDKQCGVLVFLIAEQVLESKQQNIDNRIVSKNNKIKNKIKKIVLKNIICCFVFVAGDGVFILSRNVRANNESTKINPLLTDKIQSLVLQHRQSHTDLFI